MCVVRFCLLQRSFFGLGKSINRLPKSCPPLMQCIAGTHQHSDCVIFLPKGGLGGNGNEVGNENCPASIAQLESIFTVLKCLKSNSFFESCMHDFEWPLQELKSCRLREKKTSKKTNKCSVICLSNGNLELRSNHTSSTNQA